MQGIWLGIWCTEIKARPSTKTSSMSIYMKRIKKRKLNINNDIQIWIEICFFKRCVKYVSVSASGRKCKHLQCAKQKWCLNGWQWVRRDPGLVNKLIIPWLLLFFLYCVYILNLNMKSNLDKRMACRIPCPALKLYSWCDTKILCCNILMAWL